MNMNTSIAPAVRYSLTLVLLLSLVAGVGCRYRPDPARTDRVSEASYPEVTVEGKLRTRIVMSTPTVRNDVDAPMKVTVPVRYIPLRRRIFLGNDSVDAQYRFIFLEADGTPINSNPAWKYISLPPRSQVFLTGSAMDLGAADWRCQIRPNAEMDDRLLR